MDKEWHMYAIEYYSAIKNDDILLFATMWVVFLGGLAVKNSPANAGDMGSIPGLGRSPGEENDNPLQFSCLGNPMNRGAWWATVHGVMKSWAWLSYSANTHAWMDLKSISCISVFSDLQLFVTPWTVALQAPLSMGFSRQECWNGSSFPSPENLPKPGIKPTSLALQANSLLPEAFLECHINVS